MRGIGVIALAVCAVPALGLSSTLAGGFDRAIASATPRVVKLYGARGGLQEGFGTGVIVSRDGLVLTVSSLLIDARRIRAVTEDGTRYTADVVHRDRQRQLALLRLKPATGDDQRADGDAARSNVGPFPFFDLTREAAVRPGDWVLAAGNAFKVAEGAEPVSVAHGVFSARRRLDARRRLRDFPYRGDVLIIDALTSNPGAPGSALVNLDGEFVGMIGREVISNLTYTHLNYAVPRDVLHDFLVDATMVASGGNDLALRPDGDPKAADDESQVPFDVGIRISHIGYQRVLPFVERVRSGSPAKRAGVRRDDLILSVNGRSVADAGAYEARMKTLVPGEPVDLVIRRGRTILTVRIEREKP